MLSFEYRYRKNNLRSPITIDEIIGLRTPDFFANDLFTVEYILSDSSKYFYDSNEQLVSIKCFYKKNYVGIINFNEGTICSTQSKDLITNFYYFANDSIERNLENFIQKNHIVSIGMGCFKYQYINSESSPHFSNNRKPIYPN